MALWQRMLPTSRACLVRRAPRPATVSIRPNVAAAPCPWAAPRTSIAGPAPLVWPTSSARRRYAAQAHDQNPNADAPLVATSTSNVGKLAGAVSAKFRERKAAKISVVGPAASYNAIKAIIIANRYVQDDLSEETLGFFVDKQEITNNAQEEDTVGLMLYVRAFPVVPAVEQPDIFSAHNTNVGLMAGLMANVLKSADHVTLGGMGAKAIGSALKATNIARSFLAESLGSSTDLALVPRLNEFTENGETRTRMLLTCTRAAR